MNTDLLEKNLDVFFEAYPLFQDLIESKRSGNFSAGYSYQDGILSENGEEMDREDLDFSFNRSSKPVRTAVLEGFGLGAQLKSLQSKRWNELEDIIVIEPSVERFLTSCMHHDFRDYFSNEKICFIVGQDPDACFSRFLEWLRIPVRISRMEAYQFFAHPRISSYHKNYFEVVRDEYLAVTKLLYLSGGFLEDSLVGVRNVIENIPFIEETPGINLLHHQFRDVPAVIVATGPSLKKSLPALKQLQRKALLIAADASLKILLENGITPHFVATLERDEGSKPFYENLKTFQNSESPQMVIYPLVPQSVISTYQGLKWVAYRNYGYLLFFEQQAARGIISSSFSVAHMCLRLADYLGCPEAILVGQDLAYDPETFASHSEGVAYSDWGKAKTLDELKNNVDGGILFWVPGNCHPEVPTSTVYFSFLKQYSWEVQQLSIQVTNSTQGGAKIPNIRWLPIEESTKTWEEHSDLFLRVKECREKFKKTPIDLEKLQLYVERLSQKLQSLDQQLSSFENLPPEALREVMPVLEKAKKELNQDQIFTFLFPDLIGRKILEFENQLSLHADDSISIEKFKILREWFRENARAAQGMLEILSSRPN